MTGQDAVKVAEEFHRAVPLTGLILTKVDGDARGGPPSRSVVTGVKSSSWPRARTDASSLSTRPAAGAS